MEKKEPLLFDDLRVLRTAEQLADEIWRQVAQWPNFAREVVGGQLAKAADSIGANIAEAFGRYHYGEKLQFLYYARGSLYEAKYWINRSSARQLITNEQGQAYATQLTTLARELNAFTQTIKAQRSTSKPGSQSGLSLRESPVEYVTNPVNNIEALEALFSDADLRSLQADLPTSNPEYPIPTTQYQIKEQKMPKKIYDLSQDLNADASFWPFYPPFEVKYIKRKSEHGVNAQYIMSSNHMGTHLDAPRHFVTKGKTIDQLPIEWLWGDGVIVDLSDMLDDLDMFYPADIEKRVEVRKGDILFINTGWHRFGYYSPEADEERYIQRHPGPHHSICQWLLDKEIKVWGVDMISTDHPMNLPIGRFLGAGGLNHWKKVRGICEQKFGADKIDELFPEAAYQLTHNALFPHDCVHVENIGGDIGAPELQNKRLTLGAFPWKFKGGEAAFCRCVAWLE